MDKINIAMIVIILIVRICYANSIYFALYFKPQKERAFISACGAVFPIVTGIITIIKIHNEENYKINIRSIINFVICVIMFVVLLLCSYFGLLSDFEKTDTNFDTEKKQIIVALRSSSYVDENDVVYTYDYENTGFDFVYSEDKSIKLPAHLCYINTDKKMIFDEKMNIFVADETHCEDDEKNIYYPIQYSKIDSNGDVQCSMGKSHYDRLGKAYTYKAVPYYDKNGDKYSYSFDSNTQKGIYTNVNTGEEYENEHCFVDENGYLVYDENSSFVEQDAKNVKMYKDSDGNIYYWASGIFWNENAKLLDSYGNVIE